VVDYRKMLEAKNAGVPVQVITLIGADDKTTLGQMLLVYPDGRADGILLNEAVTQQVIDHVRQTAWERPIVFQVSTGSENRFFWDKFVNSRNAVVFGGGHISQPLVEMLAMLDFEVTVVDDRPEFANRARFPRAETVICNQFSKVLSSGELKINDSAAVIIVTRGHRYDLDCLRGTIALNSGYLGMIGSRHRVAGIIKMLSEEGVTKEQLEKLRSPVGIDIGAETPAEIALCIVAEVVAVFRSGTMRPLSLQQEVKNHG